MKKELVIKKNVSGEVVCWKEFHTDVAPNTFLNIDSGLLVEVKISGTSMITTGSISVADLYGYGFLKKAFGGNKAFANCEISVLDISSEFNAEWGFGGSEGIPCTDTEYGVDAMVTVRGYYYYKVEDFITFNNVVANGRDKMTRSNLREYLRGETTAVLKDALTSLLMRDGLKQCQARSGEICAELQNSINRKLANKGLNVYNVTIDNLSYSLDHKIDRQIIDKTKMEGAKNKAVNDIVRDDINLTAEKFSKVDLPFINAINNINNNNENNKKGYARQDEPTPNYNRRNWNSNNNKKPVSNDYKTFCPYCGAKCNPKANFCSNCGKEFDE